MLYSISVDMPGNISSGTTIQPIRQPVISHALENELQLMTRSSASNKSRKDGAHG